HLRVGRGTVDLSFRRTEHGVGVEVENIRGSSEVVLSAEWPDEVAADGAGRG
ncbi:MAG: hypothetical protein IT304_01450, partial [Dehalococcoidia bacterium]|nr:hypothetical protein [Dehalococcoidia bacterium]